MRKRFAKISEYLFLIVFGLGVLVCLVSFHELTQVEQTQLSQVFQNESLQPFHLIQQAVTSHMVALEGVTALFKASDSVTRGEFSIASAMYLSKLPGVTALSYVPIVTKEKRTAFEHQARSEGMDSFQFSSFQWNSELRRAPLKDYHYPAYFVEPYHGNEKLAGYDLSSNVKFAALLEQARDSGETVVSPLITFPSDPSATTVVVAFPLYKRGGMTYSTVRRRQAVYGYIVGFLDPNKLFVGIDDAFESLDLEILDASAGNRRFDVFPRQSTIPSAFDLEQLLATQNQLRTSLPIKIGNRTWLAVAEANAKFYRAHTEYYQWIFLIVGMVITILLSAISYFQSRKHREIQRVVEKRTAELKKYTTRIRERQILLDNILANVPYGVSWKSTDLAYLGCNNMFAELAGIEKAENIVACSDADLHWPEAYGKQLQELDNRVLADGAAQLNLEWHYTKDSSKPRTVLVSAVPLKDEAGNISGILGLSVDITERKTAEEQQRAMEDQLAQSQRLEAIGQLAAGVAHEINTPVQFIGDNLRFLKEAVVDLSRLFETYSIATKAAQESGQVLPQFADAAECAKEVDSEYLLEEAPNAVEEALEGIQRVATIVKSMKAFSHPESDDVKMVDLNAALQTTITVTRNEWKYVADLETDFDEGLPMVPCFIGEINQAVLNMIVNAAHAVGDAHNGGKGLIRVSTRHDADYAEITISDNGTGIPEAAQSSVFNPFFTTKEVGRGTGQGLAIAHNVIVKKHHGTLTFETEAGQGTAFKIRLPLERSEPSEGSTDSANQQ